MKRTFVSIIAALLILGGCTEVLAQDKPKQNELSRKKIQILSDDGSYILMLGLFTTGTICVYFYRVANNYKKITEILSQEIRDLNDPDLNTRCIKAAQHTEVHKRVGLLLKKPK